MKLRNQVEWALHCCTILTGLSPGERVSTKALAEFHGIPKEYLSKALQALAQAGIVEGSLGPTGGYCLAKSPEKISILSVVEAIEGKKRSFHCEEIRANNPCLSKNAKKDKEICGIAKLMYQADEAWRKELRKVSLAQIVESVGKKLDPKLIEDSRHWLLSK